MQLRRSAASAQRVCPVCIGPQGLHRPAGLATSAQRVHRGAPKLFWLDEAFGAFQRLQEEEGQGGTAAALARLKGLREAYLSVRAEGGDRPLAEVGSNDDGSVLARTKGVWVLWMIRSDSSPLAFRELEAAWEGGKMTDLTVLRDALQPMLSGSADEFLDFWVRGTGLPDYVLMRAETRSQGGGFIVTLRMENRGQGGVPVSAAIRTEEGASHEFRIQPSGTRIEASYPVLTKPVSAAIDPNYSLLMASASRPWMRVRARRWQFF